MTKAASGRLSFSARRHANAAESFDAWILLAKRCRREAAAAIEADCLGIGLGFHVRSVDLRERSLHHFASGTAQSVTVGYDDRADEGRVGTRLESDATDQPRIFDPAVERPAPSAILGCRGPRSLD